MQSNKSKFIIFLIIFLTLSFLHVANATLSSDNNDDSFLEISSSNLIHLDGEESTLYGETITGIGDYNSDGFEDFIVGGTMWNNWQGKTWVYYGNADAKLNSKADFTIIGEPLIAGSGSCFAQTAVYLGDMNKDGIDDFGVGASGSWGAWDIGKIYIFHGNNLNSASEAEINSDFDFESQYQYDWLGETLSTAGDFNGDSYPDILVGAPGTNLDNQGDIDPFRHGQAYMYLNSPDGLPENPSIIFSNNLENTGYSSSTSGSGDINNDGLNDVVISADKFNNSQGLVYVYLGRSSLIKEPIPDLILKSDENKSGFGAYVKIINDINEDGFDEIAIQYYDENGKYAFVNLYYGHASLSEINEPDLIFSSGQKSDDFGFSIHSSGDINQDDIPDFSIGAPSPVNVAASNNDAGKVFVYFGGTNFDNIADITINGEDPGDKFGYEIATSDINGDGAPELIIGAFKHDSKGRVYIYSPFIEKTIPQLDFPIGLLALTGITGISLIPIKRKLKK